jgi:hypothetical protein
VKRAAIVLKLQEEAMMKRVLIITFVMVLGATLALAQPGRVALFGDPGGTTCAISSGTGLVSVYVFHIGTQGATGCQYSAPKPDCVNGSWLADTNVFPVTLGNSQIGVSIGYGVCRQEPIHVQTISLFVTVATPPCCIYPVLPDPSADPPGIYMVDCDENLLNPAGQSGVVNETNDCLCADIIPVRETSWGHIKALYTE